MTPAPKRPAPAGDGVVLWWCTLHNRLGCACHAPKERMYDEGPACGARLAGQGEPCVLREGHHGQHVDCALMHWRVAPAAPDDVATELARELAAERAYREAAGRDAHQLADGLNAALAETGALRAALRALVDTLPRCSTFVSLHPPRNCPEPATHLGEGRVLRCEAHARESLGAGRTPEDYGYAVQVAAARKVLGEVPP